MQNINKCKCILNLRSIISILFHISGIIMKFVFAEKEDNFGYVITSIVCFIILIICLILKNLMIK